MNTKVEEALGVLRHFNTGFGAPEKAVATIAAHIAQQDATIARLERGLATIRDSTFRNATTLRGMADYTLNQEQVK